MAVSGLTLGKFAPFHKGHQLLVETALAECDEVTCLVYDSPEVTDVPLAVRARWIRTLYPGLRVVEARGGPSHVGYTPEVQRAHERYVIDRLGIRHVDRFYSSEPYGEHMSRALGAIDRRVDTARLAVPVSASDIRANPFEHRRWLDPVVYRDLLTTAVFLGAPCTGKTTIASRVARDLGTAWVPEYGREYWERHQIGRRLTRDQLVEIAIGHLAREDARILEARRFFLVDTNALTTAVFARCYHGSVDARLAAIADACVSRYDLVFLCGDEFPYRETWDRSGPVNRAMMQRMIVEDLASRRIAAIPLAGSIETRAAQVKERLERHVRWPRVRT